ncbi:MAG: BamA/TamA family outer membrane protein [Acidobacteriota bacterium]|nr:MAG: BamA/TamA family outer membrane protein [Acidobacteriota bacterium]
MEQRPQKGPVLPLLSCLLTSHQPLLLVLALGTLHVSLLCVAAEPQQDDPAVEEPQAPRSDESDTTQDEKQKAASEGGGYGILPIPVFITEPAIGEGFGIVLALFHPTKDGAQHETLQATTPKAISDTRSEQKPPPVVSGVFGAYTSNGTWAAGIGHLNNFRRDTIRYAGALAAADVSSEFYVGGNPFGFRLEGYLTYQDLRFRLGRSKVFLGGSLMFLDAINAFDVDLGGDVPATILESDFQNAGLAVQLMYEGRDSLTMPSRGQLFAFGLWRYDEALGGDFDYWNTTLKALSFHPLHERFVLGLRLDVTAIDGDPPFFGYPWVKLRGIPALRYQDELVGAFELEGRYQVAERWSLLGFVGAGFTSGDLTFSDEDADIDNFGVGARFMALRSQNVWVGLDFAKGPEDWAWYIQLNHPW